MQFEAVSADLFNQFSAASLDEPEPATAVAHNFCDDCETPMELFDSEYHCPGCGIIIEYMADAVSDHSNSTAASIRISSGIHKGRFYNISGDYAASQLKLVQDQLMKLSNEYKGQAAISPSILKSAAEAYNRVQRTATVVDDNGQVRKFVRRGVSKNEVLAAFVYYECIRAGVSHRKKFIAQFMKLPKLGFSHGDNAYRTICLENGIDIPEVIEPVEDFVDRYCEALGISEEYSGFLIELVTLSDDKFIGMNSHRSSKVVGAIHILITQLGLPITTAQLEAAADNTKRSTFNKFVTAVRTHMRVFKPVYKKWGIPTAIAIIPY